MSQFESVAAKLDLVLAEARLRLEQLGIALADESNRSGFDWAGGPKTWSWAFTRTADLLPYRLRTTGRVTYMGDYRDLPEQWLATWRAEAWQNVSPNFHEARGEAIVGPELMTFGVLERLVLALLRRAAPAFPDVVTDIAWPSFPALPNRPSDVDHLYEVKAFHRDMIEPWTGGGAGCSPAEVDALEERLGWRLPLAYRQYLLLMGADRQGVFVGSDWFIEAAMVNTIGLELADKEVDHTPPGDTFEFMSHQGYIHGWFDLPAAGDDPPVHFYSESTPGNQVVDYPRFTDLLMAELRHMSYFTRKVRTRRPPSERT